MRDNRLPNVLVIGHAGHGKDTLAEIWREAFGVDFMSSSWAAAEIVAEKLAEEGVVYKTVEDCHADRDSYRGRWYDAIAAYNSDDPLKLTRKILAENNVYVGMRRLSEFVAGATVKIFDVVIWVDAGERLPLEGSGSMDLNKKHADIIIDNNSDLARFRRRAFNIGNLIWQI